MTGLVCVCKKTKRKNIIETKRRSEWTGERKYSLALIDDRNADAYFYEKVVINSEVEKNERVIYNIHAKIM